jgi:rubrerythrin
MDDAFTRVRVILMNGIESEALRFSHACARTNGPLQRALAQVRRVEQHQQTMVNWLNPPDQDPLETTIGFEQVAIEVTASVAEKEPDPYLAQVYRFGLLEDFDHLYRYSALMDRLQGKDANTLVQSYSDIVPGRPTAIEHRHPLDDLRRPYNRTQATPLTKLHALTIMAGEHQTHDYYMTIGPMFADPVARQLYAEIASIEEQHVTQYESIIDPEETWLEKWLLHEAGEVYNYWSCVQSEDNPRVRAIWERFLDYELGHVRFVAQLFEDTERRDAAAVLPERLPEPIRYQSHRQFVRETLRRELTLSAVGTDFVDRTQESNDTRAYRDHMNSQGSPSDTVAAGYVWRPGTELTDPAKRRTASDAEAQRRAA